MNRGITFAIACVLAGPALAEPFAKTALSGPETWKKYKVLDLELGTSRVALEAKGFTCGKHPNQRCFKIVDDRCKKARCEFKQDAMDQWFEMNGAKTSLDYVTIATTDTDSALAYDIKYIIRPRQLLSPDSTLGKALTKKYGEATDIDDPDSSDKVGGGRMQWRNPDVGSNGPNIVVDCSSTYQDYCTVDVEDYGILSVERSKQEERNEAKKRANQPNTAPAL